MTKIIFAVLLFSCMSYSYADMITNDNVLHTTVFHNINHETLTFSVDFGVGYFKNGKCEIIKSRQFESTIPDGFYAKNYGHHLAREYGPELYSCVTEKIVRVNSSSLPISWTYQLRNNGQYYTFALPNLIHVYPK